MTKRAAIVVSIFMTAVCACAEHDAAEDERLSLAKLEEPLAATRPWARWWWPGGDVEPEQLERELTAIAAAGFGGVEVQAFDAALDPSVSDEVTDRVHDVRSERFGAAVAATMRRAGELGIQVDLTVGSGWPVGGSHVDAEDASTTLMWWERSVVGPTDLDVEPVPTPTLFFTVAQVAEASFGEPLGRFLPDLAEPVAAYAAQVVEGSRDSSPLVLDDTVVLDADTVVDLSDRWVDGRLRWAVPAGRWHVVAVFSGPAGDYITLTAEQGDPYAVDHLDEAAVRASADSWFAGSELWGEAWRGIFNDSLEFKVDRLYTDDFLAEFERRRGYPLAEGILAVLSQSADSFLLDAGRVRVAPDIQVSEADEGIRWDYRQTISELFVERFVGGLAGWGDEHGALLRSQSYGIDVDVLAAAGAAHIPEVETLYAGGSRLFLKIASSAAHLNGRDRASSEAFSFILRDHMTTPLKVRAVADLQLVSGVTELVFHGVPYGASGDYGLPGWVPFSSPYGGASTFGSTFGERWEFAETLPQLNRYIARGQALMRGDEPGADLLIVYPFFGFPTSLALAEDHIEPLLGGYLPGAETDSREVPFGELSALLGPPAEDPRVSWLVALASVLDVIESCGWTWNWINPDGLAELNVDADGTLHVADARYGALLLVDTPQLRVTPAQAIERVAESGASVYLVGDIPTESPSHAERSDSALVQSAVEGINAASVRVAELAGLPAALQADAQTVSTECGGAQRAAWRLRDGELSTVMVTNLSVAESTQAWQLGECESPVVYDAWKHTAGAFEGTLSLAPYTSAFIVCDADTSDVPAPADTEFTGSAQLAEWQLTVSSALAPDETVTVVADVLGDWRDSELLAGLSGVGVYEASFELDGTATVVEVDLGWVHGTAEVQVNGQAAGVASVSPWTVDVSGMAQDGENTVSIHVTPPLRNELIARGEAGDPMYVQFAGKTGTEVASGLVGPVSVRFGRVGP